MAHAAMGSCSASLRFQLLGLCSFAAGPSQYRYLDLGGDVLKYLSQMGGSIGVNCWEKLGNC